MVLGDAASKIVDVDVCMDFEPYFKFHNLISVHPKSITVKLMFNPNMIFHVVVLVYQ